MKLTESKKINKIFEYSLKYWGMSHPFYYIKKCQRVSPTVRHTGNYQNSSNWSLFIIFSWSWDRPENPYLKMVHPKALEYIYVFHMIYTIEWKTCIKSLINITLFSKINLFLQQSVTKMTVTCYIFIKKSDKQSLLDWKWPEFALSLASMYCEASNAMSGSVDQEWATKVAVNIE